VPSVSSTFAAFEAGAHAVKPEMQITRTFIARGTT